MNGNEWTDQFKKIYQRNPNPDEFLAAKQVGFPDPQIQWEREQISRWTNDFEKHYNRSPLAEEFLEAKQAGFPPLSTGKEVSEGMAKGDQLINLKPSTEKQFSHFSSMSPAVQTGFIFLFLLVCIALSYLLAYFVIAPLII